ncbi:hypothetical protein H5410_019627 [Solanum commersonii]|uniref:RNase H type-1 domain-containing protein n=1 Tax=Solanum commersonii TaxID=4109 RepID=A0A9J5Z6T6_SOLCO|nr:hypothetical protein H5410_019627 [Solanum commersonii]
MVERIEEIREKLQQLSSQIIHIYREGNMVTDALANEVMETQTIVEYHSFQELPSKIEYHSFQELPSKIEST